MSRKKEEPQRTSSVSFRVPDFVGEDGVVYSDIEVIVEMDGNIRGTVNIAESLQRPMRAKDGDVQSSSRSLKKCLTLFQSDH
jgi:hypothetical protein